MNIQTIRERLGAGSKTILGRPWTIEIAGMPTFTATRTLQVGHVAVPLTRDTYRRSRVGIDLSLWVNEGNEMAAVADMYAAIDFAPESYIELLPPLMLEQHGLTVTIDQRGVIGPRELGPTVSWVAADLVATVRWAP